MSASKHPLEEKLLNLNSLYNSLDLQFSQKFSKDYVRLQMKTRHQKSEESLQEYAFELQRLTTLDFSDFSANVREMISLEYFVDGLKDEEIQMAVRMADVKDLKSTLLYALKVEAPIQASCIDRHSIREARVTADEPCESPCIKEIERGNASFNSSMSQKKPTRGRLQLYNVGAPFKRIAFDILGPLPRSSDVNNNILVAMDYFTKWPEAYPIPDQEASAIAEALVQHWIT
ncbi:uncharacterized protein TNCV_3481671 [Trichonephila clavipes]|nr:uncharacterized protein TNCV_3481671 [Trichonephila clavipes]